MPSCTLSRVSSSTDRHFGKIPGSWASTSTNTPRLGASIPPILMCALVTIEFTDERGVTRKLDDQEAVAYIHLLSGAGNETTARFMGWAGSSLARFPDQRATLVAR